jgi:hypothetical protein
MLSRILGRDYNDQHLPDMHNSLFEGFESGFGHTGESMHLAPDSPDCILTRTKSTDSASY